MFSIPVQIQKLKQCLVMSDKTGFGRGSRGNLSGSNTPPGPGARQYQELATKYKQTLERKEQYKQHCSELTDKCEELKDKCDRASDEIDRLRKSFNKELKETIDKQLYDKSLEIEVAYERIRTVTEERIQIQKECESLTNLNNDLQDQAKQLQSSLDEAQAELRDLEVINAELENTVMAEQGGQRQGQAVPGDAAARQELPVLTTSIAKVPPFSGSSSDNISPSLWLSNLKNLSASNRWSNDQCLNNALLALQGPAGIWKETESKLTPASFATWDAFKDAFLERFQPSTTAVEAVKLVSNLKQKQDESVRDFFDRVNHMVIMSCQDSLKKRREQWPDAEKDAQQKGFEAAQQHFIQANFVNGLKPSIRSLVESKFSSIQSRTDLLKTAVEAEVAANSISTESKRLMALESEIAALRISTGSGGQNRGNQRQGTMGRQNQQRGRSGANPGGGGGAPNPAGNHKQRVANRTRWVHCHKCLQWGKHYARECKISDAKRAQLQKQDDKVPPSGPPRDAYYDQAAMSISDDYEHAKN